ncbi:MAG: pseudouridine synthase [Actinomycetota bacterium]
MESEAPQRVQKILAAAGIASRRAAEQLIRDGRVTVNGRAVELGARASSSDTIAVDGVTIETGAPLRYFAANKPAGVVSTVSDPQGRPTVLDMLGAQELGGARLFPVGRLDMDSTGLILLTNDGLLAYRLLHPGFEVSREYLLEVEPVPRAGDLAALRKGIVLEDGDTGPARVSVLSRRGNSAQVSMSLHTGRKRQIRRSFAHLGYRVLSLSRVRFGSLGLGRLEPGGFRELTGEEVRELYRRTGWE